jgi:uncharacterized glyoxalase superfamily metalloenzyme YdcJ
MKATLLWEYFNDTHNPFEVFFSLAGIELGRRTSFDARAERTNELFLNFPS